MGHYAIIMFYHKTSPAHIHCSKREKKKRTVSITKNKTKKKKQKKIEKK
jgi:hypothetical protein